MDKRTSVLIADNSEEFCSALCSELQRSDLFQVIGVANDGEQASRLLEERRPDVLVLDLMLSKKDGLSILKSLTAGDYRPAILATSGFVTDYELLPSARMPSLINTGIEIRIYSFQRLPTGRNKSFSR